jgi:OTU domain-containing protein 6
VLIRIPLCFQATNPLFTRRTASEYMLAHRDDFLPFLPSITGEDSAGANDDGELTTKEFQKYCKLVAETGEWGGEPEVSVT